jgi:hypothetical protein
VALEVQERQAIKTGRFCMTKQQLFDVYQENSDLQGEFFELEYDYYHLCEVEKLSKYLTVNKTFKLDDVGSYE